MVWANASVQIVKRFYWLDRISSGFQVDSKRDSDFQNRSRVTARRSSALRWSSDGHWTPRASRLRTSFYSSLCSSLYLSLYSSCMIDDCSIACTIHQIVFVLKLEREPWLSLKSERSYPYFRCSPRVFLGVSRWEASWFTEILKPGSTWKIKTLLERRGHPKRLISMRVSGATIKPEGNKRIKSNKVLLFIGFYDWPAP